MKLAEIKRTYDAVYSLGYNCYPAQRLERYQLRPYSGVIDWMYSHSLSGVSSLLRNHFANFMELTNMSIQGELFNGFNYLVQDRSYGIESAHDFLVSEQPEGILRKYPEFKDTLNRRIQRFLAKMNTSKSIFFFRLGGTYEEAVELESMLSMIVKHDFCVLLVNPIPHAALIECDWPLAKVCVIQAPDQWDEKSDEIWSTIFEGIHYSEG
ncbi:DUF1796 family putative cysteine peptidase [Paenibacillus terrigena]|uniref:DUF1796 family putative cysteine peptidase n=1 Tax=Paenibacillus terrigena TaxID=369333 RepID=UPI0028D27B0F|nr:DUF1796 family putative cysteine peptidase [Paenibacillus terrigena]